MTHTEHLRLCCSTWNLSLSWDSIPQRYTFKLKSDCIPQSYPKHGQYSSKVHPQSYPKQGQYSPKVYPHHKQGQYSSKVYPQTPHNHTLSHLRPTLSEVGSRKSCYGFDKLVKNIVSGDCWRTAVSLTASCTNISLTQ